jgi:hypothetical protein
LYQTQLDHKLKQKQATKKKKTLCAVMLADPHGKEEVADISVSN